MALADQALGVLRRAIADAGLRDRTAILVSADHVWRADGWRSSPEWTVEEELASHQDTFGVPFLLKLPRQSSSIVYTEPFNTVITRQIIMDILNERLSEPERVADSIARPHGEPSN